LGERRKKARRREIKKKRKKNREEGVKERASLIRNTPCET